MFNKKLFTGLKGKACLKHVLPICYGSAASKEIEILWMMQFSTLEALFWSNIILETNVKYFCNV